MPEQVFQFTLFLVLIVNRSENLLFLRKEKVLILDDLQISIDPVAQLELSALVLQEQTQS